MATKAKKKTVRRSKRNAELNAGMNATIRQVARNLGLVDDSMMEAAKLYLAYERAKYNGC